MRKYSVSDQSVNEGVHYFQPGGLSPTVSWRRSVTRKSRRIRAKKEFRPWVELLLSAADIKIGGARPWDIHVHNEEFYPRVSADGSLGLGESYMEGWWDCERLDEFFDRVLRVELEKKITNWKDSLHVMKAKLFNLQKPARAFEVGVRHYDIGNDLYERMLDQRLMYSCGYWADAATLDDAQQAKLDLICRKLDLQPGMRVLDIGCGWGGAAQYVAERYDVQVTGITISKEQAKLAQKRCAGLPVEIRLQDYRNLDEKFDRIFSIGMFEHVGYKNYATYMRVVREALTDDGLFLLHTIGNNNSVKTTEKWIEKYIFPNSMLPSSRQISTGCEGVFVLEDWHCFGADYDTTLMHWFANFDSHWPELRENYGEVFYRMWKYYLLSCAGSFRARKNQLWQIVLSPKGRMGGYRAPR